MNEYQKAMAAARDARTACEHALAACDDVLAGLREWRVAVDDQTEALKRLPDTRRCRDDTPLLKIALDKAPEDENR